MTDRELDALIARMMGKSSDHDISCWHPSVLIHHAWMAVEWLANTQLPGHVGPTRLHTMRFCEGEYEVNFCSDFGYTTMCRDKSAARAICLAALAAVGHREGKS